MTRLACVLAVLASGCSIYWPGDHKKVVCNGPVLGEDDQPVQLYRDPSSGVCESFAIDTCGDACTPCAQGASNGAAGVALPNWASCSSACNGLDENSCRLSGGCQAQYIDDPGALTASYWDCMPVEPGPVTSPGTDCGTHDAYTCASDDQCIITYNGTANGGATTFESCGPELSPEPPPACTTLATEAACDARGDCEAVYTGTDCTCDLSGCVCKNEVFMSCEAR